MFRDANGGDKITKKSKETIITKVKIVVSSGEEVIIWKGVLLSTGIVPFLDTGGSYRYISLRIVKLYICGFSLKAFLL